MRRKASFRILRERNPQNELDSSKRGLCGNCQVHLNLSLDIDGHSNVASKLCITTIRLSTPVQFNSPIIWDGV